MSANHVDQCSVCTYGPERIDWTLSKTEIAREVGVHRQSVARHLKWAEVNGFSPSQSATVVDHRSLPDTDENGVWVPRRRWETPQGEVLNSFQFIPDGSTEEVHVDNERIDSLILDTTAYANVHSTSEVSCGTEVFAVADTQLGKAGEEGGGTAETIERVLQAAERFAARVKVSKPRTIVVTDLGDIIENCFSTPQQQGTNDRTVPEQIEDAVALYMKVLAILLPLAPRIVHVAVTSNHGEARVAMKVNPYGSENDWGLMIQRIIQGKCADRGWESIEFVRPPVNEDTAVFDTGEGVVLAFTHGHHSGTPARMKTWWEKQIVGRRPGWDADLLLSGHYHHFSAESVGNGRAMIGCPSADGGSAWFTRRTGESALRGVLTLRIEDGQWSDLSVL